MKIWPISINSFGGSAFQCEVFPVKAWKLGVQGPTWGGYQHPGTRNYCRSFHPSAAGVSRLFFFYNFCKFQVKRKSSPKGKQWVFVRKPLAFNNFFSIQSSCLHSWLPVFKGRGPDWICSSSWQSFDAPGIIGSQWTSLAICFKRPGLMGEVGGKNNCKVTLKLNHAMWVR